MLWNKNDLGMSLRYEASAKAAGEIGVAVQAFWECKNQTISMMHSQRWTAIRLIQS
jgi:hypothetical protein